LKVTLGQIALARSGDKGAHSNVGILSRQPGGYEVLRRHVTEQAVFRYFAPLQPSKVTRFEWPAIGALNFLLHDVLDGGGSLTLRIDAQGKAFGQALLEMEIELTDEEARAAGVPLPG
jgi:hypothetical protein